MTKKSTMREVEKLEAAMEANPPIIVWRLDPVRRVQVAWSVDDPHRDGGHNGAKTHCKRKHPFDEDNTLITTSGHRQCRTCTNETRKPLTPEQKQRAAELKRQRRREAQVA
jgi:hypothetical protein